MLCGVLYLCKTLNEKSVFEYFESLKTGEYKKTVSTVDIRYLSSEDKYICIDAGERTVIEYPYGKVLISGSDSMFRDLVNSEDELFFLTYDYLLGKSDFEGNNLETVDAPAEVWNEDAFLVHADEQNLYFLIKNQLQLWDEEKLKQEEIIMELKLFQEHEMYFSQCRSFGNNLIIVGENYNWNGPEGETAMGKGTVGDYNGTVIAVINLEKRECKEYYMTEGPLIYVDLEQYAILTEGKVIVYRFDGTVKREEVLKEYDTGIFCKETEFMFAAYNGDLQVFNNGELMQEIVLEVEE